MEQEAATIIGVYTKGAGRPLTAEEREAVQGMRDDIPQLIVEDWQTRGPTNLAAAVDMNVVVIAATVVGSGILGGALAEAGKDAYLTAKRALARLIHTKVEKQYATTVTVTYAATVDDVPVSVTLPLLSHVSAGEVGQDEIEERLSKQIQMAERNGQDIEQQIRTIRSAIGDDPSRSPIAFHVLFLGGRAFVHTGWLMPGWKPAPDAPVIVREDERRSGWRREV